MQCTDVFELIEPIAAGDVQMDDATRAHFETCPRCAAALASARRLETMLKAVEVPQVPASFTAAVVQRIRKDRWRSEEHVDRLFNLAIVLALLVVGGGVVAILNLDALFSIAGTGWVLAKENVREMMMLAAPTLITYTAAVGLLASAVGMWWWAERRWQF